MGLMTFQTQAAGSNSGGLSGSGPVTLTFTHLPWDPATSALLVLFLSIPLWTGYLRWNFYLMTVVVPVTVVLGTVVWVYLDLLGPNAGSLVLSSAFGVVVGVSLVFLGCALEILGILRTRRLRSRPVRIHLPGALTPPPAKAPPR